MKILDIVCVKPACLALASSFLLTGLGIGALRSQPTVSVSLNSDSPVQVADNLDRIIQPRFVQNAGMFGLSRLVPFINGHPIGYAGRFDVNTPAEISLLDRADSARRDYVIAFLHCAHVPGHFVHPGVFQPSPRGKSKLTPFPPSLATLIVTHNPSSNLPPIPAQQASDQSLMYGEVNQQFQKAAIQNFPLLRQGRPAQATVAQWTLVMRPVRASADTCVNCHSGSKRGDTLGVMVYAVGNTVNSVPLKSQLVDSQ